MKQRLLLTTGLALFMVIGMESCVRDYICRCDKKHTGYPGLPDSSYVEYPITDKKEEAKAQCEAASFTGELNGIETVESCHLY
jgi:hypothetical protein